MLAEDFEDWPLQKNAQSLAFWVCVVGETDFGTQIRLWHSFEVFHCNKQPASRHNILYTLSKERFHLSTLFWSSLQVLALPYSRSWIRVWCGLFKSQTKTSILGKTRNGNSQVYCRYWSGFRDLLPCMHQGKRQGVWAHQRLHRWRSIGHKRCKTAPHLLIQPNAKQCVQREGDILLRALMLGSWCTDSQCLFHHFIRYWI